VLRWEETDLLCRAASILDATFTHPGILLLLLSRFTPLTREDDPVAIRKVVRQAFASLNVLSQRMVGQCVRAGVCDLRSDCEWSQDHQNRWVLRRLKRCPNPYWGPRDPNLEFPFKCFDELIDKARQTCSLAGK
jgi:hypothetical protein